MTIVAQKMKKVLFLTEFFRPEPGGLEGLYTGIADYWNPSFLEVVVSCKESSYLQNASIRSEFDRTRPYPIHRISPFADSLKQMFNKSDQEQKFLKFLEERLDAFEPDHVLIGQISESSHVARYALSDYNVPYSIFLGGRDFKNKLSFFNFKDRKLVTRARNVFTLSRFIARGARDYGIPEERITVLPPGLVRLPEEGKKRKRKEFDFSEKLRGKVVLLGIGPFVPRKGFDVLLEALSLELDMKKKVHVLLVGSGPEYSYLAELVKIRELEGTVTMTGFLDEENLAEIYQLSDIFVQPGQDREDDVESLSTTLMEATAYGLPAIAGRQGGNDELLRHGINGFLVEPGNVTDFSRRLRELVFSPTLRNRQGRMAQEIAAQEFDFARTCEAIMVRV